MKSFNSLWIAHFRNIAVRRREFIGVVALLLLLKGNMLLANPTGGTVSQGSATFSSSGAQFNINQTSANALINWHSFNIGAGETVNFNQPSASSVTWNQINDPNPSQILGSLNANGYVVLQNSSGFVVGGQAAITAHGLIMTTASTPALNLGTGGPWSFNTPPPTAKIVNYGQINITGGGQGYLIANDIENNGAISAPGGKIGLFAGEKVLVSTSPDGRGLSAEATVPQGLVDNEGKLVADAGNVSLQARTVNQNGLIQANSVKDVNGTIELVASGAVNLGANSSISARGDTQGASAGGLVTIKSDQTFSDQSGSAIDIAGGALGGNGGQVEISAPLMNTINSSINGLAVDGYTSGELFLDPLNIILAASSTDPNAQYNGTVNAGDAPANGTLTLDVNSFAGTLSTISLQAQNNIELNTVWTLADQTAPATLSLSAGNNIILDDGSGINAGQNWSINLTAGTAYSGTTKPASGNDGIYLNGGAYIQAVNGNSSDANLNTINLNAANEVQVGWSGQSAGTGIANNGFGAIRTTGGGNISVTAKYGDVNSGSGTGGYTYSPTPRNSYYENVSPILGGISTAAGGNVTIKAGGDVISFPASKVSANDPGTGAFDPTTPGNVTITADGNVYGHFVEADGTGTINAGQNIGSSLLNVALSLINGGWDLNAGWNSTAQAVQSGLGNIYLQEVRNPNGVFDNALVNDPQNPRRRIPGPGSHFFDYNPQAWVSLTAGNGVHATGYNLPRPNDAVPLLLPPSVTINAGPGGVVLDTPNAIDAINNNVVLLNSDLTLFPSAYQNLQITTTGGGWLSSGNAGGTVATLLMSDSGLKQWYNTASGGAAVQPFGPSDHASVPLLLNNDTPVSINLTGSQTVNNAPILAGMEKIVLQTDKATEINVAGDMIGCSFYGENLQAVGADPNNPAPGSVTSINVGGQIYNAGSFTSVTLKDGLPTLPTADTPFNAPAGASLSSWYLPLLLAVDPNSTVFDQSYSGYPLSQLAGFLSGAGLYGSVVYNNVVYNPNTKTLTAVGPMSSDLRTALENPSLYVPRYNANGFPALDANGHFELDKINWVPNGSADASLISSLYTDSQNTVGLGPGAGAYVVGGTGQFDINAGSISLGNSVGILSVGNGTAGTVGPSYSFLAPDITSGANINVQVKANSSIPGADGSLVMLASTIASLGGGSVTVYADGEMPNSPLNDNGVGISMDLGSQDLLDFESEIVDNHKLGLGIYSTAGGNVKVTAVGTVNVDSSRIATFDSGDVTVESLTGDVNAGTGGASVIPVYYYAPDYSGIHLVEIVPANGIIAGTLTAAGQIPPGAAQTPGNVTIITPQGNIYAGVGGISQVAYNRILTPSSAGNATIGLFAGTPKNFNGDWFSEDNDWNAKLPLYVGNINLASPLICVNSVVLATGSVNGKIISAGNVYFSAAQNSDVTILAGGKVNNASSGTISGTIIAGGGVNNIGGGSLTAKVLTTSVNGGAGTLATSSSVSSTGSSAAGVTSTENQRQVASDSGEGGSKKKKKKQSGLRKTSRVTVILSSAVPPQ